MNTLLNNDRIIKVNFVKNNPHCTVCLYNKLHMTK